MSALLLHGTLLGAAILSGSGAMRLYEVRGAAPGERLGLSVCVIGDLDQDGRDDWAASRFAGSNQPALSVHSGADGSLLLDFVLAGAQAEEGSVPVVAGLGDLDGDGLPDVGLGWDAADFAGTNSGSAFAISTATGVVLHRVDGWAAGKRLGVSLLGLEDINGDGVADLMCGTGRTGIAAACSGSSGSILYTYGSSPNSQFGHALARLGDLNNDGIEDVAIGAPSTGTQSGGWACVASGAYISSGFLLTQFQAPIGVVRFGGTVAGSGDLDADGADDVLLGAPPNGGVWLHSGRTGRQIAQIPAGPPSEDLGRSLATAGDVDGDSLPDILVGAPGLGPATYGQVRLHAGSNLALLQVVWGSTRGDRFGTALAGNLDLDGVGPKDLLGGAPLAGSGAAGSVSAWSLSR